MNIVRLYYNFRKPNVAKMTSKGDIAGLIKALKFRNNEKYFQGSDIRKQSADALGSLCNQEAIIPLMECLYDQYVYVRQSAVKALCNLNAKHALQIALMDEESDIVNEAARYFGRTKDPEAVKALVDAMEKLGTMRNGDVKAALVSIGNPAVPLLKPVLRHHQNSYLRLDAASVLKDIGWTPETEQDKIDYYIATKDWTELVKMGESAYQDIRQVVQNTSEFNQEIRMKLVYTLKDAQDSCFLDLMIKALADPEQGVQNHAAISLGELGDPRAVEPLIELIKTCNVGNISSPAVFASEALGKIGDKRALRPLIDALKNGDEWLRESAAKALGELGDIDAKTALKTATQDQKTRVSSAAYAALEQLGTS